MTESPFATYRSILVDGSYSAAVFLQSFAISMYCGSAYQLNASGIRNLDAQHMRAFQEMAAWFHRFGEDDPDFVDVCKAILAERRAYAQRIKAKLDELLLADPDQYEGGRSEHAESVRFYREEHEKNVERHWFN